MAGRPAKINRSKSIVAFAAEVPTAIEAVADVVMSPGVVEPTPRLPIRDPSLSLSIHSIPVLRLIVTNAID